MSSIFVHNFLSYLVFAHTLHTHTHTHTQREREREREEHHIIADVRTVVRKWRDSQNALLLTFSITASGININVCTL